MPKRVLLLFFMVAFIAGLSAAVLAQVPAQSGFAYSVGYSLELQVNGTAVFSKTVNASLGSAGTVMVAFDYPLTLQTIANNYSAVEAGQGGSYVFPPVTETITETQTATYTTTVTTITTVVSGTTYTQTVPVGPTSVVIDEGGKRLTAALAAAGLLAIVLGALLARGGR